MKYFSKCGLRTTVSHQQPFKVSMKSNKSILKISVLISDIININGYNPHKAL